MTKTTTLVLGGARSGKSRRAQALAESLGTRRAILVTAEPFDAEMRERIARHRADRDASWRTVEAPLALPDALGGIASEAEVGGDGDGGVDGEGPPDVVLVDCLTLWLSNLLLGDHDPEAASARLLESLDRLPVPLVLVSNEVGFGLVPETPLGRRFRDEQGRLNRRVADAASRVELVVAGQVLTIRDDAARRDERGAAGGVIEPGPDGTTRLGPEPGRAR